MNIKTRNKNVFRLFTNGNKKKNSQLRCEKGLPQRHKGTK